MCRKKINLIFIISILVVFCMSPAILQSAKICVQNNEPVLSIGGFVQNDSVGATQTFQTVRNIGMLQMRANVSDEALYLVVGSSAILVILIVVLVICITVHYRKKLRFERKKSINSERDQLTGLYNEEAFYARVSKIIADAPVGTYTILRWSIDRFYIYNDLYGIPNGNELLEDIGNYTLHHFVELEDAIPARLDADHFVFCAKSEGLDVTAIISMIENMLYHLCPEFHCSVHMGLFRIEDNSVDVSTMCDRALIALQKSKEIAGQKFAWYDQSMLDALKAERQRLAEIVTALKNDEFIIYLQPQYDQFTGAIAGAEALARWVHPQEGLVLPGAFIPLMEKDGLIGQLDGIIWEKSVAFLAELCAEGYNVPISVNISRLELFNDGMSEKLVSLTKKYGVSPELLHLEITESAYMSHHEQFAALVDKLRSKGFFVEMDDFGSEYSSLNTLKYLPVDRLKLDFGFIARGGEQKNNGGIIISSVIRMAHWLNLSVLVEGVETQQQADYLKSIGCRYAQGFYYARPMSKNSFKELLKDAKTVLIQKESFTESYFNSIDFWQPESQATAIFNVLVGAAGIFECADGNLESVCVNAKFAAELDISLEKLNTYKGCVFELVHPDDKDALAAMVEKAHYSSEEFEGEGRFFGEEHGRKQIWIRFKVRRIAHTAGRTVFYVAIENITARKEIEHRMLSENEFCRLLFKSGKTVGLFDYDKTNDKLLYQTAMPSGEIICTQKDNYIKNEKNWGMLHPDDYQSSRSILGQKNGQLDCRILGKDGNFHWRRVMFNSIVHDENERVVGQILDIEEERRQERQQLTLDSRLGESIAFEPDIVGRVFQWLYQAEDIDKAIEHILQILGEYYMVSRVCIMEEIDGRCSCTYEWCASDVTPYKERLQRLDYSEIGGRAAHIARFDENGVFLVRDVNELDEHLKGVLTPLGVRSTLKCALHDDNGVTGYIGFDECNKARKWTPETIGTLMLTSRFIELFFDKKKRRRTLGVSGDFREIIDNIPAIVMLFNAEDFSIIYLGGRLLADFGYTDSEVAEMGKEGFENIVYQADLSVAQKSVRAASEGKTSDFAQEYRINKKDGTIAWVSAVSTLIPDCVGTPIYVCVITDITSRKLLEEEVNTRSQFMKLVSTISDRVIYRYDIEKKTLIAINSQLCEKLGLIPYCEDMPEGIIRKKLIASQSEEETLKFFTAVNRGEQSGIAKLQIMNTQKNELRWYEVRFLLPNTEDEIVNTAVISFMDINDEYEKEIAFSRYKNMLADSVRKHQGYLDIDLTADLVYKQGGGRLLPDIRKFEGKPYSQLADYVLKEFFTDENTKFEASEFLQRENLLQLAQMNEKTVRNFNVEHPRGVFHWMSVEIQFLVDPFNMHRRAFVVIENITDKVKQELDLINRARKDGMTDLYNKNTVESLIQSCLSGNKGRWVMLLLFDMDSLKTINDNFGHAEGDRAIKAVSTSLKSVLGGSDIIGRVGGDEFMALIDGVKNDVNKNTEIIKELLKSISQIRIGKNNDVHVQCSIGAAIAECGSTDFDSIYRKADKALYYVKRQGKNNFAFYSEEMEAE